MISFPSRLPLGSAHQAKKFSRNLNDDFIRWEVVRVDPVNRLNGDPARSQAGVQYGSRIAMRSLATGFWLVADHGEIVTRAPIQDHEDEPMVLYMSR